MRRSLRSWLWRVPIEQEVDEELAFHLEMRTRELIAGGMDPAAARETALARAGDLARLKRSCVDLGRKRDREMRLTQWLEEFQDDVKFGVRQLKGSKLFTVVATLTLALGIGVNATVFGVLKSVLLDALPYDDADRLVRVYGGPVESAQRQGPLSAGTVSDISERQRTLESLAAFVDFTPEAVLAADDGSRIVRTAWVEPRFFDTLGVPAVRGRTFQDDEGTSGLGTLSAFQLAPDTARAVVVSHGAWQQMFAGSPDAVGREVRIGGIPRTVIGVLPRDFVGPMGEADFYLAFDRDPVVAHPIFARGSQWLGLVARLKPGVTHDAVAAEIAALWSDLAREYPAQNGSLAIATLPLRDAMVGETRTPLLVLMASAGLVLLIACANLAGALLSRMVSRRKELAVRTALGAGRGRLVRQVLTESTVLALAGGAAGLLLAMLVLSMLRGLALPALPGYADLSLDRGAVVVTALLALLTGLAFGVAPAFSIDRADAQAALHDQTRGGSESRRSGYLRGALVAGQLALCVSLLVGAGLLARSLWAMTRAPLGFDSDGVLTAVLQLRPRDYPTPEARGRFLDQFMERLRALPGVDTVAHASWLPTAVRSRMSFEIEGATPRNAQPFVLFAVVSDDYFRTLRIPVRQGRTFDVRDDRDAPPTVVISESMARRYWPGGDALGTRIRLGPDSGAPLMEIVGVVADVRNDRARPDAEPMVYRPSRQGPSPGAAFLLRTQGDPLALMRPAERELAALDGGLALQLVTPLGEAVGAGLASRRIPVLLMTAFALLALLVASVGVYAMFASMATAREREFGVRMALGSRPRAIAGLVLRQGAGWMAVGLAGGAVGIVVVVRLVSDLLYEVSPFDATTLGASVATLAVCATVALIVPVRRATRVDPVIALRAQ